MKEEIIGKLKELGIPEENIETIFESISQEVMYTLFEEVAEKSTDEELGILENRIKEAKSSQHLETILLELATTVYPQNPQEEIKNIYLDLVEELKKNMEEAKELIQKAQSGDPDALKLLEEAKKTEEYQSLVGDNNTQPVQPPQQ